MDKDDLKWSYFGKTNVSVMKKIFKSILFWIIVVSILPLISLLIPGLPWTHDGPNHVVRIANFYQSLSEGNIVPRWAGNLNWGYGHPILMFLYPLPSYVGSFFHFVGFTFVDSTKIVFGLSFVFSILAMYLWIRDAWGKHAAIIASLLYGFAPYRFVDLYVRGAIGEHVAFIFPTLICYFLFKLATKYKRFTVYDLRLTNIYGIGASLSLAGLILSHNAMSLMFMPIIGLYILYLYYYETKRSFSFFLFSFSFVLLGFAMSAFFWMPALLEGKYTLRDILLKGEVNKRFVSWTSFIYSPWNYGEGYQFSKEIGLIHWAVIGSFIFIIRLIRRSEKILGLSLVILFLFTLFLMTNISEPIWNSISLMQNFQFPWRLLSIAVFIPSILGAIVIHTLERYKKIHLHLTPIILLLSLVIVLRTFPMWKPKSFIIEREEYYSGIFDSTTDTGESSPIWSTRFMEHRPTELASIIKGKGTLLPSKRNTTLREYTVNAQEPIRIAENTLYFPGWKVFIDGKETQIEYQDPEYRGIMTFVVPIGEHIIAIRFGDTKLRVIANVISVFSFGMLLTWSVFSYVAIRRIKNSNTKDS